MLPSSDTSRAHAALMLCSLALGLSATSACSPFDPSLLPSQDEEQLGCLEGSRRPPVRPVDTSAGPDAGTDFPDFWVALRDVLLDQSDERWAEIGYNIDSRCTTTANVATTIECTPPQGRPPQLDGNQGIDNAFGDSLFPLLSLAFPGLNETAIDAELRGLGSPMLRIRGWNGQLNDSQVQIILTQSVFATPSNAGAPPDVFVIGSAAYLDEAGTMLAPEPIWDGTDYFWGRDDTFAVPNAPTLDEATPLVVDNNAYVANGVLVATVPDGTEIILVGDGLGTRVRLSGMIATMNIAAIKLNEEPSTSVTIAGRWAYTDLLRTAESVGVCPGSGEFRLLDTQLRAMVDVLLDPDPENLGTPCDALSLGVTFQAYPANFGGLALGQDLPNPCEAAPAP